MPICNNPQQKVRKWAAEYSFLPLPPPALLLSPLPLGLMPGRLFWPCFSSSRSVPIPGTKIIATDMPVRGGFGLMSGAHHSGLQEATRPTSSFIPPYSPLCPHLPPYPDQVGGIFLCIFSLLVVGFFFVSAKTPETMALWLSARKSTPKPHPKVYVQMVPVQCTPQSKLSHSKIAPDVHKPCIWEPIYLFCFLYTFKLRSARYGLLPKAGRINMA